MSLHAYRVKMSITRLDPTDYDPDEFEEVEIATAGGTAEAENFVAAIPELAQKLGETWVKVQEFASLAEIDLETTQVDSNN